MARIPDELIERLKQTTDPVAVIKDRGVKLRKTGQIYKGRCPFHEDKAPSFTVTPAKKIWRCFGCDKGGNVIQFVQWLDRVSFPEAFERLGGHKLAPSIPPSDQTPSSLIAHRPMINPAKRVKLLSRVANFYQKCFANRPEGMKYLVKQRGIPKRKKGDRFIFPRNPLS